MGDVRTKFTMAKAINQMRNMGLSDAHIKEFAHSMRPKRVPKLKFSRVFIKRAIAMLQKDGVVGIYLAKSTGQALLMAGKYVVLTNRFSGKRRKPIPVKAGVPELPLVNEGVAQS